MKKPTKSLLFWLAPIRMFHRHVVWVFVAVVLAGSLLKARFLLPQSNHSNIRRSPFFCCYQQTTSSLCHRSHLFWSLLDGNMHDDRRASLSCQCLPLSFERHQRQRQRRQQLPPKKSCFLWAPNERKKYVPSLCLVGLKYERGREII